MTLKVVTLPPFLAPKTEIKVPSSEPPRPGQVSIVIHRGTIRIPFVATLTSGNSIW